MRRSCARRRKPGADVAFCRVFKDRGEAREDVPLGFDDGTVFSREEIGRTLIPAMLSRATDSDELPLSGYTPQQPVSARDNRQPPLPPGISDTRRICCSSSPA